MSRLGSLFWLMLAAGTGFAMFTVKYAVQNLDDELARVRKHTIAEQLEIRVLNAEWTYLTQPERLSELNRQFLALAPVGIKQLQHTIGEFPLRPPPPPPLETVAAAEPAPPPAPPPEPVRSNLSVTPAVLRAPAEAAPVKASPVRATRTLDDLFAQIAGDR